VSRHTGAVRFDPKASVSSLSEMIAGTNFWVIESVSGENLECTTLTKSLVS
jgi:hypothetical protein